MEPEAVNQFVAWAVADAAPGSQALPVLMGTGTFYSVALAKAWLRGHATAFLDPEAQLWLGRTFRGQVADVMGAVSVLEYHLNDSGLEYPV